MSPTPSTCGAAGGVGGGPGVAAPSLWRGGGGDSLHPLAASLASFFMAYRFECAGCEPPTVGAPGHCVGVRLALTHRAPFDRALVFSSTVPSYTQSASCISGSVHFDVTPSAAGVTWHVQPGLPEGLDLVAAAQSSSPPLRGRLKAPSPLTEKVASETAIVWSLNRASTFESRPAT